LLGSLTLPCGQAVEAHLHFAEVSEHEQGDDGAVVMDGGHHGVMAIESTPASELTGGSRAPERFPRGEGAAGVLTGSDGLQGALWDWDGFAIWVPDEAEDTWGVEDGAPVFMRIEAGEQVSAEQRHLDCVEHGADDAIAALDGAEREVGLVALLGEVLCGAALGLGVGCDDEPGEGTATARRSVRDGLGAHPVGCL
jgi:hypothetical protein